MEDLGGVNVSKSRRQKAEGRRQKAEGRRQKAEGSELLARHPSVIPSVARDLGGVVAAGLIFAPPPTQVPRYARDDSAARNGKRRNTARSILASAFILLPSAFCF